MNAVFGSGTLTCRYRDRLRPRSEEQSKPPFSNVSSSTSRRIQHDATAGPGVKSRSKIATLFFLRIENSLGVIQVHSIYGMWVRLAARRIRAGEGRFRCDRAD